MGGAQPTLEVARWRETAAAANGFAYALGGADYTDLNLASVEVAPIRSDGTLGA